MNNQVKKTQVLIIGAGPAGFSSAIYTSRANLKTTVIAGIRTGGQLMWTTEIENYAGFEKGIRGPELMTSMMKQAQRFGSEIDYSHVTAVDFSQKPFQVWTAIPKNYTYQDLENLPKQKLAEVQNEIKKTQPNYLADSVIIATGSVPLKLNVEGEKKFFGKGISICAVCDASFYKDKDTIVVGGGDVALEDALALTNFAKSVTLIHRRGEFKASKAMQDKIFKNNKIKVLWNTSVTKFIGDQNLEKVELTNEKESCQKKIDGVFLAIGNKSATSVFASSLNLHKNGFILTRKSLTKQGLEMGLNNLDNRNVVVYPSMTQIEGVFGAGDCVDVRYKQAIVAAGSGAQAGIDVAEYLS
jgi:thioredoxin reductase (NADPH)